tara:strand:+ start:383 stop:559 length:177 start_codon:yes stop_codon:yes gene_type:complete
MIITNAKYIKDAKTNTNIGVGATINEQHCNIPLDASNRHYAEILKQVADGDLTVADAD